MSTIVTTVTISVTVTPTSVNQSIVSDATSTQATSASTRTAATTTAGNSGHTNSTATPSCTPASEPASQTTGAIVGAAIGCLVAGLLLGVSLAFCFRRKRQANRDINVASAESKTFYELPPSAETRFQLAKFLPEPSPDKEIASELRSLDTLIQLHVENYYHLQPVEADHQALVVSLMRLDMGNGGSLTPEAVAQLALEPNTRRVALQHVISQVLFTSVDVSSRSQLSMLPAPLAAFLRSMPQWETGERNPEVLSFALNQWRALSSFLLHPARSQRTPLPISNTAVAPQASALADAMDTFLGNFVSHNEDSRSTQRSHLLAVITEITKFGYVLLSQPSEWRFVHTSGQHPPGQVAVVCAGLIRVTDRDGKPYPKPRRVVMPSTVPI